MKGTGFLVSWTFINRLKKQLNIEILKYEVGKFERLKGTRDHFQHYSANHGFKTDYVQVFFSTARFKEHCQKFGTLLLSMLVTMNQYG